MEYQEVIQMHNRHNENNANRTDIEVLIPRSTRDFDTNEPTIICPSCKTEIKLTESLAAPVIEAQKQKLDHEFATKEGALRKKEYLFIAREDALAKEKDSFDRLVTEQLELERQKIEAEAGRKARLALSRDLAQKDDELSVLNEVIKQRDEKLAVAQKAELDLLRKQRELDDSKREQDLIVEKRVQDSYSELLEEAQKAAQDVFKLKLLEAEQNNLSMKKQIELLRQQSERGSQQLQGEVQEIDLESTLQLGFPRDTIDPVPKGERGADVIHRVVGAPSQLCGTLLWESKRRKNWND
ncbi:MAG: DUF2130 domain-containing protein, partial [Terriglobales bacterium]